MSAAVVPARRIDDAVEVLRARRRVRRAPHRIGLERGRARPGNALAVVERIRQADLHAVVDQQRRAEIHGAARQSARRPPRYVDQRIRAQRDRARVRAQEILVTVRRVVRDRVAARIDDRRIEQRARADVDLAAALLRIGAARQQRALDIDAVAAVQVDLPPRLARRVDRAEHVHVAVRGIGRAARAAVGRELHRMRGQRVARRQRQVARLRADRDRLVH
ncbi:hypothetical protein, partial [Burkholderia ubonensis]|uniref:hypothetical protein n=1 Tax=Burkholderia ubonensis TaxID=101571 RepID=UPI0034E96A5E